MFKAEELRAHPNPLAADYSRFAVTERVLLTGHSHQAWPDCGFEAQQEAWSDAARYVDEKWEHAFERADAVRRGFADLLADRDGDYALGSSVHELLVRFLSALPLRERPRLVTTDGEFHSARRQLDRLAEEGVEIVRVPHRPAADVAARLAELVDDRTAAVLVSSVFFLTGERVPELGIVARACERHGAELFVDAYHSLGVMPFELELQGLPRAFVTGGGYKYCQLGEGNCFLRVPPRCELRPAITGWFAEFGELAEARRGDLVAYCAGPTRFAGSTYDPTSHYRAAAVFDFFRRRGLSPELLREVSQHQLRVLADGVDALDPPPELLTRPREVPLSGLGGFLVLRSPHAAELCAELRRRGVHTDSRGDALRLGPAPYLSDEQLRTAVAALGEVLRETSAA